MSTTADALGITRGNLDEPLISTAKASPKYNGEVNHEKDKMSRNRSPSREVNEEFNLREVLNQQVLSNQRIIQLLETHAVQTQMAHAQPANNSQQRSVDTLRRDIGIFSILLAMMLQTGAAFYWAGGVSKGQYAAEQTTKQIQEEQSYTRAQLQLIDGKLQKIEGREAERERNQKGR
jgi:hypothetical protein